eukprot:5449970-Prymnesium_polylepis.1
MVQAAVRRQFVAQVVANMRRQVAAIKVQAYARSQLAAPAIRERRHRFASMICMQAAGRGMLARLRARTLRQDRAHLVSVIRVQAGGRRLLARMITRRL